jgi:hypothetical protein
MPKSSSEPSASVCKPACVNEDHHWPAGLRADRLQSIPFFCSFSPPRKFRDTFSLPAPVVSEWAVSR